MKRVLVAKEFFEELLETGARIERVIVAKGLPAKCKLKHVWINELGEVELFFTESGEDEEATRYDDVEIVLKTVKK